MSVKEQSFVHKSLPTDEETIVEGISSLQESVEAQRIDAKSMWQTGKDKRARYHSRETLNHRHVC